MILSCKKFAEWISYLFTPLQGKMYSEEDDLLFISYQSEFHFEGKFWKMLIIKKLLVHNEVRSFI